MSRRFCVDTNLFIDADRTDAGAAALEAFVAARTAFVVLNAVVCQELRSGARTAAQVERLERDVIGPYERRGRVIVPTWWAWKETGRILAALFGKGELARAPRSFVNDVLIAMSCREAGVVLVTANTTDFERIARARKFDFAAPWP